MRGITRYRCSHVRQSIEEQPAEHREARRFHADGHKRGDRGRRAFVSVGRPHVKRNGRHLKEHARGHQDHRHQQQVALVDYGFGVVGVLDDLDGHYLGQRFSDGRQIGRTGQTVHHRNTVQQHSGRKRAKKKVLHRRFVRLLIAAEITDKNVNRNGHQLEGDEQGQQVHARCHEHHSNHREENERIVFAALFSFDVEILHRQQDRQSGANQKHRFEHDRVAIEHDHVVEGSSWRAFGDDPGVQDPQRDKSEAYSRERDPSDHAFAIARKHHVEHERGASKQRHDAFRHDELRRLTGDCCKVGSL